MPDPTNHQLCDVGRSMGSSWSLEKELCGLAKARTAQEALWRLGVVSEACPDVDIKEVRDWARTGSETFEYHFRVVSREATRDVVLKAIVAFSTTHSLCEVADEWVTRRGLLEGEGICTPTLYCAERAIFMEEFVPHKLSTFLQTNTPPQHRLTDQVIQIAAILDKLGFYPISPFANLRTDGVDVFMVDFGQTLGPTAVTAHRSNRLLREAIGWLNSCRANSQVVDENEATALYRRYADDTNHEAGRWT